MDRPLLVIAPLEVTRRIERTAARLDLPLLPAEPSLLEAPPEAMLDAAAQRKAGWLLTPQLPLQRLVALAEAHAHRAEPPCALAAPHPQTLARIGSRTALDTLAGQLGLRRPHVADETARGDSPWTEAERIEVWAARGVDGSVVFLGEADTSLGEDARAPLAECPPVCLTVRADGEALRGALREASHLLLRTIEGVGVFGIVWLLDPNLRIALERVRVGLPPWHTMLEAVGGMDLVETWLTVHTGGPPPPPPRAQRPDVHSVAAVVSGARKPENDAEAALTWPPTQPGKVRIEPLAPLEPPWPQDAPAPLLRVTAMGTVRHHAIQRLDRAIVSLQPRGLRLLDAPLRLVLNHEIFRAGRIDLHLRERIEAEEAARLSATGRGHHAMHGLR